jgi:hypothetical protein
MNSFRDTGLASGTTFFNLNKTSFYNRKFQKSMQGTAVFTAKEIE